MTEHQVPWKIGAFGEARVETTHALTIIVGPTTTRITRTGKDLSTVTLEFPPRHSDPVWVPADLGPATYRSRDGWSLLLIHDGCISMKVGGNVPFYIGERALTSEERNIITDADEELHICEPAQFAELIQNAALVPELGGPRAT